MYVKLIKYHLVTCKTCLLTLLALFCAIQLGFLYVVKITTGRTLDSKFVPNSLNVRSTAGETNMMFGHWFPPHIASLAGYNNYIVNFRHSYAVVLV